MGFFLLMTLCFGFLAGTSWQDSLAWDEATAVVDGTVVEIFEPGLMVKGSGSVLVRYVAGGAEYEIEIGRDLGEHFLRLGDVLPIEYAAARPGRARAVWAVETARSDLGLWAVTAGLFAVLATASGAGYLVGQLQRGRQ
ncbi:hypothetical protein [Kribbella catacumbae]|uniref:hypothetical protein n=1 Tax=Kribbella catacumbae TaxID=460086 RepID=UPI0003634398|nr:hypothetical protein [Kribbella catacumbae]